MGRQYVEGFLHEGVNIEAVVAAHFAANCYPSIPPVFIPMAIRAVRKARAGQWDAKVRLPKDAYFGGKRQASVRAVIQAFRLEAFL